MVYFWRAACRGGGGRFSLAVARGGLEKFMDHCGNMRGSVLWTAVLRPRFSRLLQHVRGRMRRKPHGVIAFATSAGGA